MRSPDLEELLAYAFGAEVPPRVVKRLRRSRDGWDPVFRDRLDELAYEFRPDLAEWELGVDEHGHVYERRLPLLD